MLLKLKKKRELFCDEGLESSSPYRLSLQGNPWQVVFITSGLRRRILLTWIAQAAWKKAISGSAQLSKIIEKFGKRVHAVIKGTHCSEIANSWPVLDIIKTIYRKGKLITTNFQVTLKCFCSFTFILWQFIHTYITFFTLGF